MKTEVIQFIGVNELLEEEQETVKKLSAEYYDKIKRALNNITSLAIHVKTHGKDGQRKKYSIHVRALAPTQVFESNSDSDWDLARTLHKSFNNIEREIQHRFKQ